MQPVRVLELLYTAPMPVSGGCPALEAITGAAFAPMAVAGGVSILAYGGGDKAAGGKQRLIIISPTRMGSIQPLS